jgi:hypothetical protein
MSCLCLIAGAWAGVQKKGQSNASRGTTKVRKVTPPKQEFRISKPVLRLGVGEVQEITISGGSDWRVTSSDPMQVEVRTTESGFIAKAKRPGEGFITTTLNGTTKQINYVIRHFAAVFPEQLTATVNGRPALPGTVKGAVEAALKRQTSFAPLATMNYSIDYLPNLGSGMVLSVPVKVKITAPGTIERTGIVTVKVTNLGVTQTQEEALWYCNDPEKVEKPGNLFAAELEPSRAVRMLYHHINEAGKGMIVRTLIMNDSDEPAQVFLTPGDSAPDFDPVGAGMKAGDRFFRAQQTGSSEVITIPPKSSLPISFRRLAPRQVISGLCSIRHFSGNEKLLIRTDAFPSVEVEPRWKAALSSSTPWREVGAQLIQPWDKLEYTLSDHIYPNPYQREELNYRVGDRFATFRLGQKAIGRADQGGRLDGNFGVSHLIELNVSNPLKETATVEVAFETSAGYSGGIFLVDDRYLVTPKMLPKVQARISKVQLRPGESRKIRIQTLPLSGSSYPATLFVRPVLQNSKVLDLVK